MAISRKRAFVREYLSDPERNQGAAAIRAGYSAASAWSQASRLLRDEKVKALIAKADEELREAAEAKWGHMIMQASEVLARMSMIAKAEIPLLVTEAGDPYIDMSRATPETLYALSEAKIEDYLDGRGEDARDVRRVAVKLSPKQAALDSLAKHHGLLVEKTEVTIKDFDAIMEAAQRRRGKAA
jgi:phage terminase small subunit